MTEAELVSLIDKVANDTIEVYGLYCRHMPKVFVVTAMAGALAACASEAAIDRDVVMAVLTDAFDDIERGEHAQSAAQDEREYDA
jgi:CRISPR/Cas system CMR-associated protein Cmr5 small subunit